MKYKRLLISSLLTVAAAFNMCVTAYAGTTHYTYNYDFWGEEVSSPDAYYVSSQFTGNELGTTNFRDPQGLFIKENRIYVCDSGNNRILQVEVNKKGEYKLVKEVLSVEIEGAESTFNYPSDLFEADDGTIYISDTRNERILILDNNFNYIRQITKPDDETVDQGQSFLPSKLVVDNAGRVFLQASNVNKGLMEFDSTGEFTSYLGANKVQVNMADYIWKTFFSTAEQVRQMELFVPTEYNNVALDYDGFIYTTTSTFNQGLIRTADPVRRLNAVGTDILIRNGYEPPYGDWHWGSAGGITGSSKFSDVVAFENDSYACLDMNRGRIFMYDFQGNLLYAFGGTGNRVGYFLYPVAIEEMGYSIFVLDSRSSTVTRFDLTEYGDTIKEAMNQYKAGNYDVSAQKWDEVLKFNGNYDLAFIGKGRAALRSGDYRAAMYYFKAKNDAENYGKAFQLYRKQWFEQNLSTIIIALVVAYILYKVIKLVLKIRKNLKGVD